MQNFRSRLDYRGAIQGAVKRGDLEVALVRIERLVDRVFCEPLNTAEIFGNRFLDDMCQRIGHFCLARIQVESTATVQARIDGAPSRRVVFVLSRLQASGGHTAVLADIVRLGGSPSTILVTGVSGPTNRRAIEHRFSDISDLHFEYAPPGLRLRKLTWLQRRLLELDPDTVWLLNHHQDSVAVAAVQPNQRYALKYLHHGDHHLCLGVFLRFGEHFDPHPMGYHSCREVLLIPDNKYLPLVARDLGHTEAGGGVDNSSALITCTAAGRNKIEVPYWLSYAEVIPAVLQKNLGQHIHIGRLSLAFRFRIWLTMRRLGVPSSSFVYIPYVNSVWQALKDYRVDVYISSFPYSGARTLVEVMGAGIPVALHSHASTRFLSTLEMAPDGACIWRDMTELNDFLMRESRQTLSERGAKARQHYEKWHAESLLSQVLKGHSLAAPVTRAALTDTVDELGRALEIARQASLSRVLHSYWVRFGRWLQAARA